jgi:hypothetical protein
MVVLRPHLQLRWNWKNCENDALEGVYLCAVLVILNSLVDQSTHLPCWEETESLAIEDENIASGWESI